VVFFAIVKISLANSRPFFEKVEWIFVTFPFQSRGEPLI